MVDRSRTPTLSTSRAGRAPSTPPATDDPATDDPATLEQQVVDLQRALHNSRQIGAATGILMARHGWSYEQAFEWLRRVSQSSNRKVSDLADEIVLTGTVEARPGAGNSSGPARPRPV